MVFHAPRVNRTLFLMVVATVATLLTGSAQVPGRTPGPQLDRLLSQASSQGSVRVIASLNTSFVPEPILATPQAVGEQRAGIGRAQDALLRRLSGMAVRGVRRLATVPFVALDVDATTLAALASAPEVATVWPDSVDRLTLAQSAPQVGAPTVWTNGVTGTGWTVAVLDTGVDKNHPFLEGKVVSEACFGTNSASVGASSMCPGGATQSTQPGSGSPCAHQDCFHGTHVAGIAVGAGPSFSGVARGASSVALQVFSQIANTAICGNSSPCIGSFVSDQIAALERVYTLRQAFNIAAVNMSLGGELSAVACDDDPRKPIIDTLRAAGIVAVASSGNNGSSSRITAPACISSVVSVGSVGDGSSGQRFDVVSSFSNSSTLLDMLAPGASITSSIPGGTFSTLNGTSMAAPHVSGALALLRQQDPQLGAAELQGRLMSTGLPITDSRNGLVHPRLRADAAIAAGCNYSVSPVSLDAPYLPTTRTVTVLAPLGCGWSSSTTAAWLRITSGATGAGNGGVTVEISQNLATSQRSATLLVAGRTIEVRQAPAPCAVSVLPSALSFPASGSTLSISITATTSDCGWSAGSSDPWITLSTARGAGSGSVLVTVAANPLSAQRTGSVTVGGQVVAITQSGVVCTYSVAPTSISAPAAGGDRAVTVEANAADCQWGVSSSVSWVSVTKNSSGTGATVTVLANSSSLPRTTTVAVGGQPVTVSQSGVTCAYTFSPSEPTIGAEGGTLQLGVTANASDCGWTPVSSEAWLHVPSTPQTGSVSLVIAVDPHDRAKPRSGAITVGTDRVTVTQLGVPCGFTLTPSAVTVPQPGGTDSLTVSPSLSDCMWTVSSSASWLTVVGKADGVGPGLITFAASANSLSASRVATLSVGTASTTVTQSGVVCSVRLSAVEQNVAASGGAVGVGVSANAADCAWSVHADTPWLTPSSVNGVGSGSAQFVAAANPLSVSRDGRVSLGDLFTTIRQLGVVCSYAIEPSAVAFDAGGGGAPLRVVANAEDCSWSASQVPTWVTPSETEGVGTRGITLTAAANGLAASRSAALVIAGVSVGITQRGLVCTFALSSTAASIDASGGAIPLRVGVNAPDCAVPTSSSVPWIRVTTAPASGLQRTATLLVEAHVRAAGRQGSVSIGGQVATVSQRGVVCEFRLAPSQLPVSAAGGVVRTVVTANASDCGWSVVGRSAWVVPASTGGVGSQSVDFSVSPNLDEVPRAASFEVAGQDLIVNQGSRNVGSSEDGDDDTLPDAWEVRFGLSPAVGTGGDGPNGDPDGDGVTNLDEFVRGTHPRGFTTRYLAEGATSSFFSTRIALANPTASAANVLLRFVRNDSVPTSHYVLVPARARRTVDVSAVEGLQVAEFSTIIESDVSVLVDRLMSWDATRYGTHLETAVASPAMTWYLAEGATTDPFELFYLLENPNGTPSRARVRFVLSSGQVIERLYDVPAATRVTVWADRADPRLVAAEFSAIIEVVTGPPIIVERAMYLSRPESLFAAGHESAGVPAAATTWYLAEGATGSYFDTFLLLLNPGNVAATVRIRYLLGTGAAVVKTYTVGPQRRVTLWADYEDPRLADTGFGAIVESTNGVPIVVERSMWWPGGNWQEAHGAAGSRVTSRRWGLAEGEQGGPLASQTYVLISNVSATSTVVNVTLLFENRAALTRAISLGPSSRYALNVAGLFPEAVGRRFSTLVESGGSTPGQLVVEQAIYSTPPGGPVWAGGAAEGATPLP